MIRLYKRWLLFTAIFLLGSPLKGDEVGKIVILGEWNFQGSFLQCRDLTSNSPLRLGFYWRSGGGTGSRQGKDFQEFAKVIRALDKFDAWNTLDDKRISIPWGEDFVAGFSASGLSLNFSKEPKSAIHMSWEDARLVATAIEKGWDRILAEQ